jgi:hypothetical protein
VTNPNSVTWSVPTPGFAKGSNEAISLHSKKNNVLDASSGNFVRDELELYNKMKDEMSKETPFT